MYLYIGLGVFGFLALFFLFASFYAYRKTFYQRRITPYDRINMKSFAPYEERIRELIDTMVERECERVTLTARDGTSLFARYYHVSDDAPLEILAHGYRGHALRDFAGGAKLCLDVGHNLLLIDQRAHGESGGKTISFGIKERFDILDWIDYARERFGEEKKIILVGVSMGAGTVIMAAGERLPDNVVGVIADCPFSAPVDIIERVGADRGFPKFLIKPLVFSGARLFGRFSLTECSPREAAARANVPILIIHGDADDFVPFSMSEEIQKANPSIMLEKIEGAEHAVSYLKDTERYTSLITKFKDEILGR